MTMFFVFQRGGGSSLATTLAEVRRIPQLPPIWQVPPFFWNRVTFRRYSEGLPQQY